VINLGFHKNTELHEIINYQLPKEGPLPHSVITYSSHSCGLN